MNHSSKAFEEFDENWNDKEARKTNRKAEKDFFKPVKAYKSPKATPAIEEFKETVLTSITDKVASMPDADPVEIKTLLDSEVPEGTLGIVYLCEYAYTPPSIKVIRELFFANTSIAMEAYANIPNPASQVVLGKDRNSLMRELQSLHNNMSSPEWLEQLGDML